LKTKNITETLDDVRHSLTTLVAQGVKGVDVSEDVLERMARWGSGLTQPPESLEDVSKDLGECQRCPLFKTRTRLVFGVGDPRARLVFVGEGPGHDEDQQGEPFVGAAGQLLTRIIGAMGLSREQVYICNIIKCRPPGNRNPSPEEIATCSPFLKRQLAVIQPDFICSLGTFATQTLLNTQTPISRLRGRFHEFEGIQVLPTYHPAYLLRNSEKKRDVWNDMKTLMTAMGLKIESK
jgi:uracil-DNA glycosylase